MARKPKCYHGIDPEIWPSMDPMDKEKARWKCPCNRKRRQEAKRRIKWWKRVYSGTRTFDKEALASLREDDPEEWSWQTGVELSEVRDFEQKQLDLKLERSEEARYKRLAKKEKALNRLEFLRKVRGQYREHIPGREDMERLEALDREQYELHWTNMQEAACALGNTLNSTISKSPEMSPGTAGPALSTLLLD